MVHTKEKHNDERKYLAKPLLRYHKSLGNTCLSINTQAKCGGMGKGIQLI
jgi:hypothetical protein